ncbi:MAG: type 4a pilus biogenesis protein PilO [Actinobacteria bacterium]|nr:type 4a pilus biogenesis protein PilO [Actinomycetota bacterium]MBU1942253.1 type 4a pilus biogenesis protein PilO [Actinomycetota bacterium]MBU2687398.1 type 4a pilus biogenesis protein PilO [Actinomycetota bacterium]
MSIFRRPAIALLIGLLLAIVVGALGYFLLVGPRKGTIDDKQKDIEAKQQQIETEKGNLRQLQDIKNHAAEYEAQLAQLQAKIPKEPDLPSLIRNIQAAADPGSGAGVPWLSFAPGEIAAGEGGAFQQFTFSMRAGGFYDEIVDLIYRMERFARAVVIDTVNIVQSAGFLQRTYDLNLGVVQMDLTAKAFTFAPVAPGEGGAVTPTTPTPGTTPSSTAPPTSTAPGTSP